MLIALISYQSYIYPFSLYISYILYAVYPQNCKKQKQKKVFEPSLLYVLSFPMNTTDGTVHHPSLRSYLISPTISAYRRNTRTATLSTFFFWGFRVLFEIINRRTNKTKPFPFGSLLVVLLHR